MSLPITIQPCVDQAIVGKVTRLFNGTIADVLQELFQNARRAGARNLHVNVFDRGGTPHLSVYDDGRGIDDPATLLALGRSGWDEETARREDPAGMGVFSLAGRDVVVRSFSRSANCGWMVSIPASGWETAAPLAIRTDSITHGTQFEFAMPPSWADYLDRAVHDAARFYPVPVHFNGSILPQESFLAAAESVECWNGCRIGVYRKKLSQSFEPRINFHGVTVRCSMPEIREVDYDPSIWSARVEIVDAPNLQLVLPARKEMVAGPGLDALRAEVEAAIYRTIATQTEHRLSYKDWRRAAELGITSPEAAPWLNAWVPVSADRQRMAIGEPIRDVPMGIIDRFESDVEQSAAQVLGNGDPLGFRIVRQQPAFQGYSWYDALPRIDDITFSIERCGQECRYDSDGLAPDILEQGTASAITMNIALRPSSDVEAEPAIHSFPLDMLVCLNDHTELCDAAVFVRENATVTPADLASFLEASCFYCYDDKDCDSWDTQHRNFIWDARNLAVSLLHGEEAALTERLQTAIREDLLWLIPPGRRIELSATSTEMKLTLADSA